MSGKKRSKKDPAVEEMDGQVATADPFAELNGDAINDVPEGMLEDMAADVPAQQEVMATEVVEDDDFSFTVQTDPQLKALEHLAAGLAGWRPAREVLVKVRAVPTIFVQYDRATRCGGHPIDRFATIHGPSGNGKSTVAHGIGVSFLKRGHIYAYIDAEMTTPDDWLQKLLGDYARNPGFLAMRPDTYEQTVNAVRGLLLRKVCLEEGHKLYQGKCTKCGGKDVSEDDPRLAANTSAFIVVDSLRKLVPEDMWAKIRKYGAEGEKGSVDGYGGRGAQIKAAMNAQWLDELTPLLAKTGGAMAAIARESEDTEADANARKFDRAYKVGGGKSVVYDSSLVLRVTAQKKVYDKEGEDGTVVGTRHCITIRKTKVSGQDDENTKCYFHTSNGVLIPEGFDRARDVLELARHYKIVEDRGSWLTWTNHRWQGLTQAVKKLTATPAALDELDRLVRDRFSPDDELEVET